MLSWAILVMTVITLIVLYLGWRLISPLPVRPKRKVTLWLFLAVMLYGHRVTWFLQRSGGKYECMTCDSIDWVGFTFFGFISILIIFMLIRDIPHLISSIMGDCPGAWPVITGSGGKVISWPGPGAGG